ncbi:MAG: hypothetical protein H7270_04905 [Dermatophilaceae bacterium]|nr:hypothetical protein [Dermatophilaceae bacterium]
MGRVASTGDYAVMQSWHALLQKNVLDHRRWRTRDELHEAIVFLGRVHLQPPPALTATGKLTPVEYELALTNQAAAVAA